ncbi:uncharacterized protein [Rutidosis leptorrhynchoides]|uniref:uncharacterized protein n=1 Tax=Rutidosis leptorrhynchoides TaxID=125765 RepID=UPI003A990371
MADQTKFHSALSVHNIKSLIPITLEINKSHYSSWAELFEVHCRAYGVIDHIITPTPPTAPATVSDPPAVDTYLWARLDAVVLQWIYGTISNDLLLSILKKGATAKQAWDRLKSIIQDNKSSRAVHLRTQFSNTRLENFPDISSYCQELKSIADQLDNVGPKIDETNLVLQLVTGLGDNYESIATLISHTKPLPSFYDARSMLILEETRKSKQLAVNSSNTHTALLSKNPSHQMRTNGSSGNSTQRNGNSNFRGRSTGRNARGRGSSNRGRGRNNFSFNPTPYWQQNYSWP